VWRLGDPGRQRAGGQRRADPGTGGEDLTAGRIRDGGGQGAPVPAYGEGDPPGRDPVEVVDRPVDGVEHPLAHPGRRGRTPLLLAQHHVVRPAGGEALADEGLDREVGAGDDIGPAALRVRDLDAGRSEFECPGTGLGHELDGQLPQLGRLVGVAPGDRPAGIAHAAARDGAV
jgi:hypothetical protein